MIKIAIQKKGRLSDRSMQLLKECGIRLSNGKGNLVAKAKNFPLEILFLRDDDIPEYVEQKVAHAGILGLNEVKEKGKNVKLEKELGFSQCRLCLAIPKGVEYTGVKFFEGKKVATSYPNILREYFESNNIQASIEEIGGSVEIAPNIGLSDGIFDIVSSGSTLISNGLKEVETVLTSEAVMISNPDLSEKERALLDEILFRIQSVLLSEENKYILLNAPNESIDKITELLPGMKSPTILPLSKAGWSSLHSVIKEEEFWEKITELRNAGAEGILIVPIEKMIL